MKKSFISLFLFSLFLTVFGSLSVKADPVATLSFVYDSAGNDKDCNGNDIEAGKGAVGGDFQWSGKITDAIEKNGDWIGVDGSTRACSRSTSSVHLDATGDYTFTMDVKWTEGGTRNLPRITITGQSEKTPDIGSSYTFTNNETKTLVYTFNGLAAGYYDISVYFEHGERTKQFVKNLVIASSAPATPTPCSSSLTIEVEGNYAASGDYSGVTYPSSILFKEKDPSGSEYRQGCHGTGYVSFEASTSAEILIPVNIPVSGTYKVKAYAGRNKNMYINIYATTSTGQGSITYKSTTYYKQTYKNINGSHDSDSFVESDYTDAVPLPTGICLIGLYAEWSYSAWDQITITRTDGTAFCPNNITMAKSGDDGADAPTASPANAAMAGTVVTITAGEASANHYFSGWTVSPENAVTFANPTSATTTFVMPEADVTITANYTTCTQRTVTLAADNVERGSVSGGGDYCEGASVTVTATPNDGYRFVNWTQGGSQVSTDAVYTFTLSEDISLTANFAVEICSNNLTIQCEDYDPEITKPSAGHTKPSNYRVQGQRIDGDDGGYGTAYGDAFASFRESGDTEIFYYLYLSAGTYTFTVRCSNGNTKKVVLYNAAGDTKLQELVLGLDWDGNTWHEYTTSSWTAASSAYYYIGLRASDNWAVFDQMTITASSNVFCPNTITMAKSGDESAAAPTSSPASHAMPGATVTVTAGAPSANHYFSGWTASPSVTFEDATALSTTFVMPAEDVTITANYGAIVSSALTFTAGEGGVVSATAGDEDISSGDEVISGTSVTLTAAANSNYVFINWTDDNNSDAVVSTNAAFTFSMPATATSYTANFAQVDNVIVTGGVTKISDVEYGGDATMVVTSVPDFDAFNHNVLQFAYSDMDGKYKGQKVAIDEGYSSASSAGATGFGFYYKTEKADDDVAFCFDTQNGQVKWELQATNNVWKYYYFAHAEAASWNHDGIIIFMNGDDDGANTHTTYKDGGAFYMSEIAATSITSKPDIDSYTYTRDITSNSYGTLCLPMEGTVTGATLYSVAGKQDEGGKLYIVLEEQGDALEAGEPYIFETDGSPLTATMSGPHSAVIADANGLVGTYTEITAPVYNDPNDLNYVLAPGNNGDVVFKKVGSGVTVGAYHAYINIKNACDYSPASAAPGRKYIRFGIEGTEEEQAVEMIYDDASLRTRKIMQNGHLYILRDGHLFTAQGTQIK